MRSIVLYYIAFVCFPEVWRTATAAIIKGDDYDDDHFELDPLPYTFDALEPYISEKTLRIHHGKHHAKYVNTLNSLIKGNPEFDSISDLVQLMVESRESNKAVFNNAAQAWNHAFYWSCMTPESDDPPGSLERILEESFGSFDEFKNQFADAGNSAFGSGWAWLVYDAAEEDFFVMHTIGADNPHAMNRTWFPMLTMDVWEHAYYLDYQNRRPSYTSTFLENLVNWEFVNEKLQDIVRDGPANLDETENDSAEGDEIEDENESNAEL
eukprot:scaffold6299_cov107-Cylindrotheca_fusiformis.AAC.2